MYIYGLGEEHNIMVLSYSLCGYSLLSNSRLATVLVARQICMDGLQYVKFPVGIMITTFVFIEPKQSRDFHPTVLSSWLAR